VTATPEEALVPPWPAFVGPVLDALAGGEPRRNRDARADAIASMNLSEDVLTSTVPSGTRRVDDRSSWAVTHLAKSGYIEAVARGVHRITEKGRTWRSANPLGITTYAQARALFDADWETPATNGTQASPAASGTVAQSPATTAVSEESPDEQIDTAVAQLNGLVGGELLTRLRESHPDFFEDAVVKLLLAMGYGGAEQRGKRIGGTADGGVDGVIDQDALGLDQVYVQAKRYAETNTIGREVIQAFVGALAGVGASRGVFITTSSFTRHARDYAAGIPQRVILIDGQRLVNLMLKYKVGAQVKTTYEVVEIDEDFFD